MRTRVRARMPLQNFFAPSRNSFALALAFILLFVPDHRVHRNTELDITRLQKSECEYRGISASFEEVTRAYALKIYQEMELVGWEARPSDKNPFTETVVTATFTAAALKPYRHPVEPQIDMARRRGLASFEVSWRYSTIGSISISADNIYARDALKVFQRTVDDFIAQMVLVASPTALLQGPGPDYPIVQQVEAGTVLLLEDEHEHWSYVRLPAAKTAGWLKKEHLLVLEQPH